MCVRRDVDVYCLHLFPLGASLSILNDIMRCVNNANEK